VRRTRLLWQLFPSYLLITIVSVAAASSYAFFSFRSFYRQEIVTTLKARASLLEERLRPELAPGGDPALEALVKKLGRATGTRITVVLPSGEVVADSDADPGVMENHADRPEIAAAMGGRVGTAERESPTLRTGMLYVAIPIVERGSIVGVVRAALPSTSAELELRTLGTRVGLSAAVLSILAAAVSLVVSRRLSRPLEEMKQGALRFARGEFGKALPVPRTEELGDLAESLNRMAAELDVKMSALEQQRAQEEAILTGMVEGVIAIDARERLIAMNRAAGVAFGVDPAAARGRALREVVRNTDLHRLAALALESAGTVEANVAIVTGGERSLQARGAALTDAAGARVGAVLVLNDVTRMRRLETMRRDFVSNVSHELRTPVTSIRGYAETLLDGSVGGPDEARRFLSIIAKQAERLESIIEDLLYLSRIEQDAGEARIATEDAAIADVLRAAVESRRELASGKSIAVALHSAEGVRAKVNVELLEHAVANLLDNAIKFSEPGTRVEIDAAVSGTEVVIRVRDRGCGIAPEHLPRIFERFYRVDKGRSRELGGTGLGLAIVKHIAHAHGGQVSVESAPGRGSTFEIRLPRGNTSTAKGGTERTR
jgi:two-component system phosphate regulon sensor histidine kinase PhoR